MDVNLDHAMATALGCILTDPTHAPAVFSVVRVDDFVEQYRGVAEAIHGLRLSKVEVNALAVIDEMTRRGTIASSGGAAGVMRINGFGFGDPGYATQIIARHARLRRLQITALRTEAATHHSDADPHQIACLMLDEAQGVVDLVEADGDITTQTLGEFLSGEDPPYDWVMPGLIERGDRLVLTGSEGLGKSVLQRQLAVAAASGIHPFTHAPIPPMRVLYVDCENGPVKLRRALRPLMIAGKQQGHDPSDRMWLEAIPSGLDLTKIEDENWLVRLVSGLQPDLLLTGPLYRLHAANPNDEEPARCVSRVLDRCRVAANCALITEAHSGHGSAGEKRPIRPVGSSLWLRWPEFGYGLRATDNYDPHNRLVDFTPWRGDREERAWPKQLQSSGGAWPWRAVEERAWSPTDALGA